MFKMIIDTLLYREVRNELMLSFQSAILTSYMSGNN